MTNSEGKTFTTNVAGTYITKQISGAKRAREAYEREIDQARSLFGQTEKFFLPLPELIRRKMEREETWEVIRLRRKSLPWRISRRK